MYFYLKEPNINKTTPIYLIYYVNSKDNYFKFSTGQKVHPEDWDFDSRYPKLKRGAAGKKSKQISMVLDNYKSFLEDQIRISEISNTSLSKSQLKIAFTQHFKNKTLTIKPDTKTTIVTEAINDFITVKSNSKSKTKDWQNKYKNLIHKITLFETYNNSPTRFKDINVNWIDAYCGFLRELPELLENKVYYKKVQALKGNFKLPKTSYNDNTLNRHITYLFTFLNWSSNDYHKLNLDKLQNPVKNFISDDVHLTDHEVKLIEEVTLPRESLKKVRDLFLIGVYSGQRFSDYSVFEKADVQGDLIIKKAEKTETESFIPLHPKLKKLLEKYNWNLPKISSQKFNPHIKEVCRIAGITEDVKTTNYKGAIKEVNYTEKCELVGSHTARRTFITLSAEKNMPDHIIMKITGIRDAKTLVKYKKTNQQTVTDFVNKIWG